jgi:hypothetical protein
MSPAFNVHESCKELEEKRYSVWNCLGFSTMIRWMSPASLKRDDLSKCTVMHQNRYRVDFTLVIKIIKRLEQPKVKALTNFHLF